MGQLWNRMKRVIGSYVNDLTRDDPDYARIDPKILEELRHRTNGTAPASGSRNQRVSHSGYETEEERLKRMIDEAAHPHRNQQETSSQSRSSSAPNTTVTSALSTLGLPTNASVEDIKRAYKRMMMQYHPDRVSSLDIAAQNAARDKAQQINQAYQILEEAKGF
jgi:DnaJ domain